ncbi:ATP-binding protein [Streptomyces sp. NPDC020707]|jgi:anti-sigma regulatory factor (Ser/Thr protein kinase)|uniref:ATP-binding protein n=1 Tax=Streptomyces TaxID=1883 RepID=UPI0028D68789|nr:ATP-binding protein [Streptomyces sp. DSM 40484]
MDRTDTTAIASAAGPPGMMSWAPAPVTTAAPGPAPVTTAAMARAYARSVVLEQWNNADRTATEAALIDLSLVVSELAANAVRHGGGLAGFEVTPTPQGVRLAVHDNSDVVPDAAFGPGNLPTKHHGSGYGWPVILRLARDIAVDPRPGGGKTVSVLVPLV